MKIRTLFLSTTLLFGLATGCSNNNEKAFEKMVTMVEEISKAVDGAGDDCGKMATAVEAVVKKYEGDLDDMKKAAEAIKGDKAEAEKIMKKYEERMDRALPGMLAMVECSEDPKMRDLSLRLSGLM